MHVPLLLSFWFTVAAYVVHCIDESLLGGSFVEKVRQHWWPEYSWTKFFWFNFAYFVVMVASVVLYDFRGNAWMILPLASVRMTAHRNASSATAKCVRSISRVSRRSEIVTARCAAT